MRAGPFEGLPAPPMAAQTLVLALILRHSGASEFVGPGRSERHEATGHGLSFLALHSFGQLLERLKRQGEFVSLSATCASGSAVGMIPHESAWIPGGISH